MAKETFPLQEPLYYRVYCRY